MAFEALDARYRAAILRYCRRLLSDPDEAEDAVQQTFMAAYTSLVASHEDVDVRPWLYVIARNHCYSILRARREVAVGELDEGMSEEPGAAVLRREDLRDLVLDVSRLPEDQRAALIMAELGAHSHDEIAGVLEVPRAKVKALVFQARESLLATRRARETDCADIRRQLRTRRGAALRGATLRRHLHDCPGCREYRRQLRHQRPQFAAVLPLAPMLALRALLMRTVEAGRTAPLTGGAGTASAAVKLGALKPLAGALAAMLSAASAVVAVHSMAPHAATHRSAPVLHRGAAPVRKPAHPATARPVARGRTAVRRSVGHRTPGPPGRVSRARIVGARKRVHRRSAAMDSRVVRRLAALHAVAARRVIALRRRERVRTAPPKRTVSRPALQPPVVPTMPPILPRPVTPPVVMHGHDVPLPSPDPPQGEPGEAADLGLPTPGSGTPPPTQDPVRTVTPPRHTTPPRATRRPVPTR